MSKVEYDTKKSNSWEKKDRKPKDISQEEFVKVCSESRSMAHAAATLGMHYGTFKTYAVKYDCYQPNQSGKGFGKKIQARVWDLEKWNADEVIETTRNVIRRWVQRLNLLPHRCNTCGIGEWNGKPIALELNHINGNGWEHRKSNLEWLCPNCHSQTHNFRGKNK